jgi:hypothetical protein
MNGADSVERAQNSFRGILLTLWNDKGRDEGVSPRSQVHWLDPIRLRDTWSLVFAKV